MSTTVIVIKGNSSRSLLNRIADALKSEEENVSSVSKTANDTQRTKAPYTTTYHFDQNQERLVKQFVKKNKVFKFAALKNFLRAAGYEKIWNRDLVLCLNKLDVEKFSTENNKIVWASRNILNAK